MSSELVSIVLPVYNAQKYVGAAVESILRQSYKKFELIIVDDGSTDDSLSVVSSYADSRIKIHKNKNNLGVVKSLNIGVSLSIGDYIARMDSDDIAFPERIAKQLEYIKINNYDLVSARAITFGENENKIFPMKLNPLEIEFGLLFVNLIVHPLVFARSEVLKKNIYSNGYDGAEDYHLWTSLISKGYKLSVQEDVLLHYRIHKSQISRINRLKQIELADCVKTQYFSMLGHNSEASGNDYFSIGTNRFSLLCKNDRYKDISSHVKLKMLFEVGIKNIKSYRHFNIIRSLAEEFNIDVPVQYWLIACILFIDGLIFADKLKVKLGLK
jgi:glycosyltransferase involved in cell wall biosynthesis